MDKTGALFTQEELQEALDTIKSGKAPVPDRILTDIKRNKKSILIGLRTFLTFGK